MNTPAWVVASLLSLISVMMTSHLYLLHVGIDECDKLFDVQLEQARRLAKIQKEQVTIIPQNPECTELEEEYSNVADQYMEVFLALLGGGGIAASKGWGEKTREPRKPLDPRDPRA